MARAETRGPAPGVPRDDRAKRTGRAPADDRVKRTGGAPQDDPAERAGETPPDDPLTRLADRLERASDAAERLMDEATARFTGAAKPPPSGWQTQEQADAPSRLPSAELALVLQSLRELVPSDLQSRLTEAIRELMLAIRALLDWYIERLEQRRAEPVQVQDIPVL